jgi:excisionase family DNA binding protein
MKIPSQFPPQQLDFPSLSFGKDRTVLTVQEVAGKWNVSDRHVVDLIEEGKLVAFDIAGKHGYVRVPMAFWNEIARRLNVTPETLLREMAAARPQSSGNRAYYRIPVVEGYQAFMKENHSLAPISVASK